MTPSRFNRFFVCLLDVLGFESRFNEAGLGGILGKYERLVQLVNERNALTERWFGPMKFNEGIYWTADGGGFVSQRLYGTYASDSIVLFAHADFPDNRYPAAVNLSEHERERLAKDPARGWVYQTIPCDNFLDLCCEVLCSSIEIGLPLRGAISLGEAVLHLDKGIYLGQPLIEAARLEKPQRGISAAFSNSFMGQTIPKRYLLQYDGHFKSDTPIQFGGSILDWPRHWRATRAATINDALAVLDIDTSYSPYYENTREIVALSESYDHLFNDRDDVLLTSVYPQLSSSQLKLQVRAVRAGGQTTSEREGDA